MAITERGYNIFAYDCSKEQLSSLKLYKISGALCAILLWGISFGLLFAKKIAMAPFMIMMILGFFMLMVPFIVTALERYTNGPYLGRRYVAGKNLYGELFIFDVDSESFRNYTGYNRYHDKSLVPEIRMMNAPYVNSSLETTLNGIYKNKIIEKIFDEEKENEIGLKVRGISGITPVFFGFSCKVITGIRDDGKEEKTKVYFYKSIDDYNELKALLESMQG